MDGVNADREERDEVVANVVGFRIARDTRALRSGGDGGARDAGTGFIQDGAGEAAGGLTEKRGRAQEHGDHDHGDSETEGSYPHERNSFRVPRCCDSFSIGHARLATPARSRNMAIAKITLGGSESHIERFCAAKSLLRSIRKYSTRRG